MYNEKIWYVYILASKRNGTIYTGFTNDLARRVTEHKLKIIEGFTKKHNVTNLVWYKYGYSPEGAIEVEHKIKNRKRKYKLKLIESMNPEWNDLSLNFLDPATNAQDDFE